MTKTVDLDAFRERMDRQRTDEYLRFFGPVTGRFLRAVADAADDGLGRRALDLGCGDGRLARLLLDGGWWCLAVDRSPHMVELAGRRLGTTRVAVADAYALPVADGAVNAVVSAFLVPHLDDLGRGLAEMHRVVRTGGTLVLATWGHPRRSPFTGLAMDLIGEHAEPGAEAAFAGLTERTGPGYLDARLAEAGFSLSDVVPAVAEVRPGTPREWWAGLMRGSMGLAHLLNHCAPLARDTVREVFLRRAEETSVAGQVITSAEALVVSATAR